MRRYLIVLTALALVAIPSGIALAVARHPKNPVFIYLYQNDGQGNNATYGITVYEDPITGCLVYMPNLGYSLSVPASPSVVCPSQLSPAAISNLEQYGYKPVR